MRFLILKNEKLEFSSIEWEGLPENLETFISGSIYVDSIDNLNYETNSQNWSFNMNLDSSNNYNYPLNSKTKIDLKYNGNDATATCTFISTTTEHKFICVPDIEIQAENDIFEISNVKKDGTIIFLSAEEKSIILSSSHLKFEMIYDLLLLSKGKCFFKIKVSETNLPNQRSIIVDFKEGYNYRTAICTMNEGILNCKSLQSVSITNQIYLIKGVILIKKNLFMLI